MSKTIENEDRWHSLQIVMVNYDDNIRVFDALQKVVKKDQCFPTTKQRQGE